MKKFLDKSNRVSRREVLARFITFLPLFFLFPKTKWVQWQGVLSLPKPMNWDMCYDYLKRIMDIKSLISLESEMKEKKTLLFNEVNLNGNQKVKFVFTFKTIKDYQYWSRKSNLFLKHEYFNKNDYHTKVKTIFI